MSTIEIPMDQETCNTAVIAWAHKLEVNEAEKYIQKMWAHGWVPDRIAFAAVIEACAQTGDIQRCELWRKEASTATDHRALPAPTFKVAVLTVPCDAVAPVMGHTVTYL